MSNPILSPFQLLELNVISAQDLHNVSRNMKTYAVAWVHPERKLTTRVDNTGRMNPTWNDKFVFRVNEDFIQAETSAVMVEIYAMHWFKDVHVGTIRVLISNLMPELRSKQKNHNMGMRFAALQVRRSSGRPQGILNIGISVLDSSMRSMPLYMQLGSAVGYKTLMGETDLHSSHQTLNTQEQLIHYHTSTYGKPQLRRTKSDTSTMVESSVVTKKKPKRASSSVGVPDLPKKKGTSGSVLSTNGSQLSSSGKKKGKTGSIVNGAPIVKKGRASSSIVTGSEIIQSTPKPNSKIESSKSSPKAAKSTIETKTNGFTTFTGLEYGTAYKPVSRNGSGYTTPRTYHRPIITESELGPSASEVAAKLAKDHHDNDSSVVSGLSLDGSVEGLRSKLQRWTTELPPVYDNSEYSSYPSSQAKAAMTASKVKSNGSKHQRRHTVDGAGDGLFSCFGNICGIECHIVCGGPTGNNGGQKKIGGGPGGGSNGRLIKHGEEDDDEDDDDDVSYV
ncbi:hypothetical protein ACFE04_014689 [Oxalis oulophora]